MKQLLIKRPWLLVVIAFLLLIGAWATLIYVGVTHAPEAVPLEASPGAGKAD